MAVSDSGRFRSRGIQQPCHSIVTRCNSLNIAYRLGSSCGNYRYYYSARPESLSKGAVVVRQAHHERLDYPAFLCNLDVLFKSSITNLAYYITQATSGCRFTTE